MHSITATYFTCISERFKWNTYVKIITKPRRCAFTLYTWVACILVNLARENDRLVLGQIWHLPRSKQETRGVTGKFGLGVRNEAGQRLIEFCQENAQVRANALFQQQKRRLYKWTSPDGQHQTQINYILCSQRWRSSIQSAKTRPGANCDSDHELLIARFRLKLRKVGKTTRPSRYDLNQIPYDYTM